MQYSMSHHHLTPPGVASEAQQWAVSNATSSAIGAVLAPACTTGGKKSAKKIERLKYGASLSQPASHSLTLIRSAMLGIPNGAGLATDSLNISPFAPSAVEMVDKFASVLGGERIDDGKSIGPPP